MNFVQTFVNLEPRQNTSKGVRRGGAEVFTWHLRRNRMSRFFGNEQFFNTKPLIINKNVYNFIFPDSVKFLRDLVPRSPTTKLYTCTECVKFFSSKLESTI